MIGALYSKLAVLKPPPERAGGADTDSRLYSQSLASFCICQPFWPPGPSGDYSERKQHLRSYLHSPFAAGSLKAFSENLEAKLKTWIWFTYLT